MSLNFFTISYITPFPKGKEACLNQQQANF